MRSLFRLSLYALALGILVSAHASVRAQNYEVTQTFGASIVPGTTDIGNHCVDCLTQINLPFPYALYDQSFTTAKVSSNGNIQFGNSNNTTFINNSLPAFGFLYTIFPYWDDLTTFDTPSGQGVFTSVSGVAPDRIFNIEFRMRRCCQGGPPVYDFEVRLYENQRRFDLVYGNLLDNGGSATIGVQKDNSAFTQYSFNQFSVSAGTQLTFTSGHIVISEFRLNGPGGTGDEYVELYNPTGTDISLSGFIVSHLSADDGTRVEYTLPAGAVIRARSHYLVTDAAYSLGAHAAGDTSSGLIIPQTGGVGLFRPEGTSAASRVDAVLFANASGLPAASTAPFREGTPLPQTGGSTAEHAWVRDSSSGAPKDTNDNASDFRLVSTDGAALGGVQSALGAPGPENSGSPVDRTQQFGAFLLDASQGAAAAPNRVRDFTPGDPNTSPQGTLVIRRRFTNNTGAPVTRLRFRVTSVTGFPRQTADSADLRPISSSESLVAVNDSQTCGGLSPCTVTVRGLTLEGPAQPHGGGLNSSLSLSAVTPAQAGSGGGDGDAPAPSGLPSSDGTIGLSSPLASGGSVNVQFVLGVVQPGQFRFYVNIEALP